MNDVGGGGKVLCLYGKPDGINDLKLYRKYSLSTVYTPAILAADGIHCTIFISRLMN